MDEALIHLRRARPDAHAVLGADRLELAEFACSPSLSVERAEKVA